MYSLNFLYFNRLQKTINYSEYSLNIKIIKTWLKCSKKVLPIYSTNIFSSHQLKAIPVHSMVL